MARELLVAHEFLRQRSLQADLVFVLEERADESDNLVDALWTLVRDMGSSERLDRPGGIFIIRKEQLASDDILLMETAARVVIDGGAGSSVIPARPHRMGPVAA